MAKEYYLPYLGKITSVAQANKKSYVDNNIVFVTVREEGKPGAIYNVNPENGDMQQLPLAMGGRHCIQDGDLTWVAGGDNHLYLVNQAKLSVKKVGKSFEKEINGIAILSQDRLAVLIEATIFIISNKGGHLQSFELDNTASCIAADVTGDWCAVGTLSGKVFVFSSEGEKEFSLSEQEKIHEGAVESLIFDPEELRFYSSGTDRKLFSTLARGKLEPEDRGRDGAHSGRITAMVNTPGERFITGSHDKSCKAWLMNSKARPATLSSGIVKVDNLSLVNVHGRPHLVVQCTDNSLRLFILDASGKIGEQTIKLYDAYSKARRELDESLGYKAELRERALQDLHSYGDIASVGILANQVLADPDLKLREKATQLLVDTQHPAAVKNLFPLLNNEQARVRELAFLGLQKLNLNDEFNNLDLAIASKKTDIAFLALERYSQLATKDSRAHNKLVNALNADPYEIRAKALFLLESLPADNPAEVDILALSSKKPDLKRIALMQLYQRQLLKESRVRANLKRVFEDSDPDVRRMAFLVSLLVYPKLAKAVRERDKKIHSDLFDIESFNISDVFSDKKINKKALPSLKKTKVNLDSEDYSPLMQAMAGKHIDVALNGVNGLALLNDPRAYGYLLQLSTEQSEDVRIGVCDSFAALGVERATSRLIAMCNSESVRVRDAAFSAILAIHNKDPLTAVKHGLISVHADVRKRAQQSLIRAVKKAPPSEGSMEWSLLLDRLNDKDASVRNEAFKTILNLQLGGGEENTLELLRSSMHADIRREVQTEAMAEISKSWAMPLLLKFIEDPDKALREDTLNFLLKRSKGRDLSPLALAAKCKYADTRHFAITELTKNPSQERDELLSLCLEDEVADNRKLAINAIVGRSHRDLLVQALDNSHSDIRLQAAIALARIGDNVCEKTLLEFIQQKEPEKKADKPQWKTNIVKALEGVSRLGSESSEQSLKQLLESPHAELQRASAEALFWTASDYQTLAFLRSHTDKKIREFALLASALDGNKTDALNVISSELPLPIRLGVITSNLEDFSEHLIVLLDSEDRKEFPLLLLIFLIALAPTFPRSKDLLSVLGSVQPANKLNSAIMLEYSNNREVQIEVVKEYLNRKEWNITSEDIHHLSCIFSDGSFVFIVKTLEILVSLLESEPDRWNLLWTNHKLRYAKQMDDLRQLKTKQQTEDFTDIVFGTYLGLLREVPNNKQPNINQTIAVKQAALTHLSALGSKNDSLGISINTVIIQTLGDSVKSIRELAFDILQERLEAAVLAEECLQTKHVDLGVKALELLTKAASKKQAKDILSKVMCERQDFLAVEATKMLLDNESIVVVCKVGFHSHNARVRSYCAEILLKDDESDSSRKLLYATLKSPYKTLRMQISTGLAYKKDSKALDVLFDLLKEEEDQRQQRVLINAIQTIGTEAAASGLLGRAENDPSNTADVDRIFYAVGKLRIKSVVDRLIKLSEREVFRGLSLEALLSISGYDQTIENPEEERVSHTNWEEEQFPRHDDVLEILAQKALSYGELAFLCRLIPCARWARGAELQSVLETLARHPDDNLRNAAVEALGWRLRKRDGAADTLVLALEHKSPDTKFIAAESLAKAGRREGFSILLSAVELMQDIDHRIRAVKALGELADQRSVDLLLRLADDYEHALQQVAAEAIGHLGTSNKSEQIFQLLERFTRSDNYGLVLSAVRGLRWLNTRRSWQLIRDIAGILSHYGQEQAIIALGFAEKEDANRNVLLKILEADRYYFDAKMRAAYESAKLLFGESSLEPEIHLYKSGCYSATREEESALKKLTKEASGEQIFYLLPSVAEPIQEVLLESLLERDDISINAIAEALGQKDVSAIKVSCDVLGNGRIKESTKQAKDVNVAIQSSLTFLLEAWSQYYEKLQLNDQYAENSFENAKLVLVENALKRLIWLCGRRQLAQDSLADVLQQHGSEERFNDVRLAAVMALVAFDRGLETLCGQLEHAHAEIRYFIASTLAGSDAKIAESVKLDALDRHAIQRMRHNAAIQKSAKQVLSNVNYQSYVLPSLVAEKDVSALAKVASDESLAESTRIGAVEALANIATNDSDEVLIAIGKSQKCDEELRKSAWRCLRRSKRLRAAG